MQIEVAIRLREAGVVCVTVNLRTRQERNTHGRQGDKSVGTHWKTMNLEREVSKCMLIEHECYVRLLVWRLRD